MKQEEINRRNKILAEFIGMECREVYPPISSTKFLFSNNGILDDIGNYLQSLRTNELKFDIDYNWIMKIWDKIEMLDIVEKVGLSKHVQIMPSDRFIGFKPYIYGVNDNKIEAMFICFSDFAEWYLKRKEDE